VEAEPSANVARVLAVYDALNRRDWMALQRQFSPDLVLRVAGKSSLAGEHLGLGAAIALATKIERRVVPQQSTIDELIEEIDQVHAVVTVSIEAAGGPFRARLHEVFRFDDDGLVREVWVKAEDQRAVDAFLGGRPAV
jgi:ketosteroid isomerase-like protein